MKNIINLPKGIALFMLFFSISISAAQVGRKAKTFQKKGHYYYKLFQKEEAKANKNDALMLKYLQKADLSFNRALILYNTNPRVYKEKIRKIKLYLQIILHYRVQIAQKKRSFISTH